MKVILLRDVAKLGRKAQVCDVPSGHAINFLIPRKLALPATTENMKRHAAETARLTHNIANTEASFRSVLAALQDKKVTYAAGANEQGHLFRGIHAADIAQRLKEEGFAVDKNAVVLAHPIKALGIHAVPLKQGNLEGVCTLEVIKQ